MLKITTTLLLLCLISVSRAETAIEIPDIGNSADTILSLKQEKKIGDQFLRYTRRNVDLINDPEVEAYIQALGERLVSYLDKAEHEYTFFVVNSAQINAFAVPGGYIGINAGLIIAADNESELASVIAHEIAHVSQRHISRTIEKSASVNLATIASVFAAIALSSQGGDASMAALSVGMAAGQQAHINFTRTHEKEADRIGIQLLAGANYDPNGMARFFQKLHQESRYYEHGLPEILMTHPVTLNRIADAKNRAAQYSLEGNIDQPSFPIFRAKVRTLLSNKTQQLEQETLTFYNKQPLPELAYQLALLENLNGKYPQAEQRLRQLIQQQGEHPWYTIALADSLQQQRQGETARDLYQKALQIYPGNKGLTHNYAELLLQQHAYDEAAELLKEYLRNSHQPTPISYQLYAQAEDRRGHKTESAAALAEYFFLSGQSAVAVQHLENAIQATDDNTYRLPALQQRLTEIKAIALEEKSQN